MPMKRRSFLKQAVAMPVLGAAIPSVAPNGQATGGGLPNGHYTPGRIPNEYNLFLPGEREALRNSPRVLSFRDGVVTAELGGETRTLKSGESIGGWHMLALIPWLNG